MRDRRFQENPKRCLEFGPAELASCPSLTGSRGQGRRRSVDLWFFRPALYRLSYLTMPDSQANQGTEFLRIRLAGTTGFEPATSGLTGRRTLQTVLRALELCASRRLRDRPGKYIGQPFLLNIKAGYRGRLTRSRPLALEWRVSEVDLCQGEADTSQGGPDA